MSVVVACFAHFRFMFCCNSQSESRLFPRRPLKSVLSGAFGTSQKKTKTQRRQLASVAKRVREKKTSSVVGGSENISNLRPRPHVHAYLKKQKRISVVASRMCDNGILGHVYFTVPRPLTPNTQLSTPGYSRGVVDVTV